MHAHQQSRNNEMFYVVTNSGLFNLYANILSLKPLRLQKQSFAVLRLWQFRSSVVRVLECCRITTKMTKTVKMKTIETSGDGFCLHEEYCGYLLWLSRPAGAGWWDGCLQGCRYIIPINVR